MSYLSEQLGIATDRQTSGRVVIRSAGSLDGPGSEALIEETAQIDPHRGDHVVVRLDQVSCVDAAGIGALYYLEAFVKARGGRFVIDAPRGQIRSILDAAGLARSLGPGDAMAPIETDVAGQGHSDRDHQRAGPR